MLRLSSAITFVLISAHTFGSNLAHANSPANQNQASKKAEAKKCEAQIIASLLQKVEALTTSESPENQSLGKTIEVVTFAVQNEKVYSQNFLRSNLVCQEKDGRYSLLNLHEQLKTKIASESSLWERGLANIRSLIPSGERTYEFSKAPTSDECYKKGTKRRQYEVNTPYCSCAKERLLYEAGRTDRSKNILANRVRVDIRIKTKSDGKIYERPWFFTTPGKLCTAESLEETHESIDLLFSNPKNLDTRTGLWVEQGPQAHNPESDTTICRASHRMFRGIAVDVSHSCTVKPGSEGEAEAKQE